jgi:cytosine/adenosine deaminase-related metal-dependent hydrolase
LYRKFSADHIFTGHKIFEGRFVLITTTDGVVVDIIDVKDAGDDVEHFSGLISPGFVNAHCHLELSHLKGVIPVGTGLVPFVQQVMAKGTHSDEAKLAAMQTAALEMYDNGIQAVGDICNTGDTITIKQQSNLRWHNFIEVSGFTDAAANKRLTDIKSVFDTFRSKKLLNTTLSPHAPYSVSKTLFGLLNNETANQLITIHNQECSAENDLYKSKSGGFLDLYENFSIDISSFEPTGKTSLQSWLPYFSSNQSIISVHNTFSKQADVDFCSQRLNSNKLQDAYVGELFFCICINANKYIEQKIPPIDLLVKNNCAIVIGTDSYASNWQLDILAEIKTIQLQTFFKISLEEILQWATINGARALQMDDTLGSFEKNKKPGVVLIEGVTDFNTTPFSTAKRIL